MGQYEELLKTAFGAKKAAKAPPGDPANLKPEESAPGFKPDLSEVKAEYDKKAPVTRDQFDPQITGTVQATVWKDGNPPPPKAPTSAMTKQGTVPAMNNQEGWGKI